MAIVDGLICQIYPQDGETTVKNIVDESALTKTGTGTLSLVDIGGEKAWRLQDDVIVNQLLTPAHTIENAADGSGMTIAARVRIDSWGANNFDTVFGIRVAAATQFQALRVTKNGSAGALRARLSNQGSSSLTGETFTSTIRTIVLQVDINNPGAESNKVWVDKAGRVLNDPDFESPAYNINTSFDMDTPFITSLLIMYQLSLQCIMKENLALLTLLTKRMTL